MTSSTSTPEPSLIDMETLHRCAPIIRTAAHPLRLRILDYLRLAGAPCTVGQIVDSCPAGQAAVSQQLRILRDQGTLAARRQGHNVLYEVADDSLLLLLECIRRHQGRAG